MKRSLLVICLMITACHVAMAAGDGPKVTTRQIPIEHFGANDGLSQGLITAMAQDSDGYIWIGTKDGLNRYDGYTFKVYRYQMSDSTSIASNYVTSLYVDEANRLWIGTETQGVYLFDRATETFIHMQNSPRVSGSLRGRSIGFTIWGDGQGHIMIPMNAVPRYDVITISPPASTDGKETYTIGRMENVFPGSGPALIHYFSQLSLQALGGIWRIREDSVFYFPTHTSMDNGQYLSYQMPLTDQCHGPWRLLTDPQQKQVYLLECNELYRFDEAGKRFKSILMLPDGYSYGRSYRIDRQGRMWNIQLDNSFLRIDICTGAIEHLEPVAPASVTKDLQQYGFNFQDKYDNIWIGSPGMGIIKISAGADLFKRMPELTQLSKNIGTIWPYRTAKPGIKADLDIVSYDTLQSLLNMLPLSQETQVLPDAPLILAKDASGSFWVESVTSSSHFRLVKSDPVKRTATVISNYGGDIDNWPYLPIIPDTRGGIWYSERAISDSAHLYHIRAGGYDIETYVFPVKSELGASRFVNDWYEEGDGTLWFATRMGVFSLHPDTKQWEHYGRVHGKKGSLSFNQVLCICPDPTEPSRYMWAGTEGGGLNKLDRSTGQCTVYTVEDGLPNNVIYAVQSDKHNNLWISTNNGLCLFDPHTLQIRNFSTSDGLPGNEFNRFQFSRSATGILCFGGVEGTVYFDPEDFYKNNAPAKMVFTQLKLSNKPVTQHGIAGIPNAYKLPCPIEQARELVFAYDQHLISFDFALLDLSSPAKNKYRYKLEGLNDDWIDNGYNHEVTLTNLAPGSYTLRVAGQNGNGIWSAQEAIMRITIQHPWWGTWWFRIAAVLILLSILYALYRYRLRQALQMERVRNRIAQDLHDEIGSTLSSISLYSAVMEKLSPDMPQNASAILHKIRQSTSQMMESMNDIVWTIKADNDDFEQVVDRMRGFAVNMTEAKGIDLHFKADAIAGKLKMNMDQRKNIYLIFKEAVNNSVKYASGKNLYIHISVQNGKLQMTISDDGVGFDESAAPTGNLLSGGNGLRSMRLRAKDIGGELSIESATGKGTRIVLTVPV